MGKASLSNATTGFSAKGMMTTALSAWSRPAEMFRSLKRNSAGFPISPSSPPPATKPLRRWLVHATMASSFQV